MTETMKNLTNETADGAVEGVARVATNGQAADGEKPIIRICDLHKNYDDLVVLRGVDLEVKRGEVVVFAYAVYKSRAHRDRVMKKVMADPRLAGMTPQTMPFDGKRMFWGGFKSFIALKAG